MFIPTDILPYATFPGVIMHEIAHRLMCDFLGIPVYEVRYFIAGPAESGYVTHEHIHNVTHAFFTSFAPLFINSLLCMLFTFPFYIAKAVDATMPHHYFLFWIGISMGVNALPSYHDVSLFLRVAKKKGLSRHFFIQWINSVFSALHDSLCSIHFLLAYSLSWILPYFVLN